MDVGDYILPKRGLRNPRDTSGVSVIYDDQRDNKWIRSFLARNIDSGNEFSVIESHYRVMTEDEWISYLGMMYEEIREDVMWTEITDMLRGT